MSIKVFESIKDLLNISPDPSTILQFALPNILEKTKKDYFEKKKLDTESKCGLHTKLDLSLLEDITDDVDFCMKLAREENLVLLPGVVFGKNNWVRISIGVERSMLDDAFVRLKGFITRHVKSQTT
ncbi:Tyrosine transaminase family protein [Raphanus sativus]|nr:Tyrosine transaminase family protein [Raphanus sativus]